MNSDARGGTEGNERLTVITGVLLILLLAALGVTIVFIGRLLWWHLFLGLLLIGPVVLKVASTGYRFMRYYTADPPYRRKGPPPSALRTLGPALVGLTAVVFATGVALFSWGIVVALPERSCPVAETTRVAGWLADHSAGQCGPCVNGLAAIADGLAAVCQGNEGPGLPWITRWCQQVVGRGACAHPDGFAGFVASAVSVFAEELADHARYGPCDACDAAPVLATPPTLTAVRG
jgi:hypothetical protein